MARTRKRKHPRIIIRNAASGVTISRDAALRMIIAGQARYISESEIESGEFAPVGVRSALRWQRGYDEAVAVEPRDYRKIREILKNLPCLLPAIAMTRPGKS